MKNLFLTAVLALSLSACATGPSAYGPSNSGSSLGFKNTQIEQDRFRISYTGRSSEEAQDYALLRAAQIALAEGYSHFKIINGHMSDNGPTSPISTSIGIGSRNGWYGRNSTGVNVGIGIYDVARALQGNKITNVIEVRLLRSGGADKSVYNAQNVAESIRPTVFTPDAD